MGIVTMSNILHIVGQFQRPLVKGEAVLDSNMLVVIGRLVQQDDDPVNVLKVWCLCLQSSSVFDNPHELDVHVDMSKLGVEIFLKLFCSCTAGESAKCKHLIAVLLHLFKLDDEGDLEELSCTDLQQQWGKIKAAVKKDFQPIPISEYDSVDKNIPSVYSKGIPSVDADMAAKFAQKIAMGDPRSEIYMHSHKERADKCKANVKAAKEEEAAAGRRSENATLVTSKLLEIKVFPCLEELTKISEDKIETLPADIRNFYNEHVVVSKERSLEIASQTSSQSEEQWFSHGGNKWSRGSEKSRIMSGSRCSPPSLKMASGNVTAVRPFRGGTERCFVRPVSRLG